MSTLNSMDLPVNSLLLNYIFGYSAQRKKNTVPPPSLILQRVTLFPTVKLFFCAATVSNLSHDDRSLLAATKTPWKLRTYSKLDILWKFKCACLKNVNHVELCVGCWCRRTTVMNPQGSVISTHSPSESTPVLKVLGSRTISPRHRRFSLISAVHNIADSHILIRTKTQRQMYTVCERHLHLTEKKKICNTFGH